MSSVFGGVLGGLLKLEQALAAVQPAPNGYTMELDDTILLKKSTLPDLTNTMSSTAIHINDNNSVFFSVNESQMQFESSLGFNTQTAGEIVMEGVAGGTTTVGFENVEVAGTSGDIAAFGFSPSTNTNPQMYLSNSGAGLSIILNTSSLQVAASSSAHNFMFQTNDNFFKWDAGVSFRTDIDDHHVNKDMSFKVVNGGGEIDFQNYETYLDENGLAGWSVIVSEGSGADAMIKNPDGLWFYGFGISGYTQQSNFALKKWATARITLVPSTTFAPGFAWAVSMY